MKKIQLLLFISISTLFLACGGTEEYIETDDERTIYDMWNYMTPPNSFQVEYDIYRNGKKDDYIIETVRVFDDNHIERESSDGITSLRLRREAVEVKEPNGTTIQVQRFVKLGDRDIFKSSSNYCKVDEFHRGITIKGIEFYRVLKIICKDGSKINEFYYGFNEGIVATYSEDTREVIELVKIDERGLNR